VSGGVYNKTYFENRPEEQLEEGVLYGVILVNQKTFHVIKRSRGFKGYDLRIQRTYHDTIYNCWKKEQELHEEFKDDRHYPAEKFGGHTECFKIDSKILSHFPKNNS
jgi:hypothetical protein